MRHKPRPRVVLTDDELAAQLRTEGVPQSEIDRRLDARWQAQAKAQADYDGNRTESKNDKALKHAAG